MESRLSDMRAAGADVEAKPEGRGGRESAYRCPRCGQPRTRIDEKGRCPVCRERDRARRFERRKAVLLNGLSNSELYKVSALLAGPSQEGSRLAARAESEALAEELRIMERFIEGLGD